MKRLRVRRGYTQAELARRWRISRATVSRWEQEGPPGWVKDALASLPQK